MFGQDSRLWKRRRPDAGAGQTTVDGFLNSTPNADFRLEFFVSQAANQTGFGGGQLFLDSRDLSADVNGDLNFNLNLPPVSASFNYISVTATDITDGGFGPANNTSPFSGAFPVAGCFSTVTNTNDAHGGSLRDAIICSNILPGVDTIRFIAMAWLTAPTSIFATPIASRTTRCGPPRTSIGID